MSLSRERIVAAKARADAATEAFDSKGLGTTVVAGEDLAYYFDEGGAWTLLDFVETAAREDVPVMADALLRVLDLHRRAHAVFSWNSGTKYEEPCPHCDGKAGVHDCGCWADSDIEYVCAECHRLGSRSSGVYDYAWPCATVRAVTGDGSSSNTERSEQ